MYKGNGYIISTTVVNFWWLIRNKNILTNRNMCHLSVYLVKTEVLFKSLCGYKLLTITNIPCIPKK